MRVVIGGRPAIRYIVEVSADGKCLVVEENNGRNRVEINAESLNTLVSFLEKSGLIEAQDMAPYNGALHKIESQARLIERQKARIAELEAQCKPISE